MNLLLTIREVKSKPDHLSGWTGKKLAAGMFGSKILAIASNTTPFAQKLPEPTVTELTVQYTIATYRGEISIQNLFAGIGLAINDAGIPVEQRRVTTVVRLDAPTDIDIHKCGTYS